MKKILQLILLFLFIGNMGYAQTLLLQESFEGDATNYDANLFNDFGDPDPTYHNDHFSVINSASPPGGWPTFGPFRGFDGTHYLGGEDTQNTTNPLGSTEFAYVVIKKINISAYESIQLKVLLAAVSGTTTGEEESFERSDIDGLDIQYAFDANAATAGDSNVNTGSYTTIGSFRGDQISDGWSSDLFNDIDFDDYGDGVGLTEAFQEFTYEIDNSGGGATEISIRIIFRATAGSEEIAVDNIRISGMSGAMPEMNIKGLGNTIIDNDNSPTSSDDTDFGSFEKSSGSNTNTFTIENTGDATLNLTASSPYVTISGDDADFTLVQTPSNSIASAGSSNFQVKFDPVTTGQRIAEISIANDDSNENPYNFKVQGSATSSAVRTPTQRELDNFTTGISGALASTRLDDNKVLISYRNGTSITTDYLTAVIGTVSGTDISYGSGVEIENGIYSGTSIVALSTTKAVVFYHHNEDPEDRLRYNVLDISGDNITVYSSELVGTGIWRSGSNTMSAIALNGNQLVIAFQAEEGTNDNLYVQTGIVNAQDITWGTKVAVTTNIRNTDITRFSDSQFALVYSHIDGDGKVVSGTVSGNTISLGSSQTFESSTAVNKVALEALSSSQLVIAYEDEGSSNPDDPGYIMYATISGTTFSFPGEKTRFYYGGDGIDDLDLGMLSSTEVFLAIDGGDGDPSVYYVGELSSNNIDLSSETTFVADQADDISVACLTSSLVVLNYTDDENNSGVGEDNGASRVLTLGTVSMPEMDIQGNSVSIADGSSSPSATNHTDFGSTGVSTGTFVRTFTIENTGNATLTLTDASPYVSISGHTSDFTLTQTPSGTIAASESETFQITFNPTAGGTRSATLSIANDDSDENPYNFSIQGTGYTAPTVTTTAASSISTSSAILGGDVTSDGGAGVSDRGVVYSTTDATPTIAEGATQDANGSGTGSFSETIGSLTANTTYYYNSYAENTEGISYGTASSLTTLSPTVAFNSTSSNGLESVSSANLQVDLSAVSGLDVSVDYAVTGTATGSGTDYTLANGTLTISVAAANDNITIAGIVDDILDENNETVIVTLSNPINATLGTNTAHTYTITDDDDVPNVTTQAVTSITQTTATGNGNITDLGTPNPTAHGMCWNTTGTPFLSDDFTNKGAVSVTGAFTSNLTSLSPNTTYYARAYVTNEVGTTYGVIESFTTLEEPTVTTQAVTSITKTTATGNGNITNLGAPNPTAHGVCWNTGGTPTLADYYTNKGAVSASGAFTSDMTSLDANTTYYVRAYVTNTADTVYGNEVFFTTEDEFPWVLFMPAILGPPVEKYYYF